MADFLFGFGYNSFLHLGILHELHIFVQAWKVVQGLLQWKLFSCTTIFTTSNVSALFHAFMTTMTPKYQPSVSQRFSTRTRLSVKTRNFHNINIKNHEELSQQLCTNVINLLQEVNQSIIVEYWCEDVWSPELLSHVKSGAELAVSRVHAMSHLFPFRIAFIFFSQALILMMGETENFI